MKKVYVLIFYLFCTIVFTWPAVLHLNDMVIGDGGDNYENLSYQYVVADNLSKGAFPLTHNDVFRYPDGFNLGLASHARLAVLTGGILTYFFDGILVYNILILFIFTLNGFFSYLFFKEISNSSLLGLVGGLIYGFNFCFLSMGAGYINYLSIFCFPLSGYLLIKLLKKTNFKNLLIFIFSLLLIALSTFQYLMVELVFILVILPICFIFWPREIIKRIKRMINPIYFFKGEIIFIVFLSVIYIFYYQFFNAFIASKINVLPWQNNKLVPLESFILPSKFSTTYLSKFLYNYLPENTNDIDYSLFFGVIEIILFLIFIFKRKSKTEHFILISFVVFWILSLGIGYPERKIFLPYYFLAYFYPFKGVYNTEKLFPIFYLFFTIGSIYALKYLKKNKLNKIIFYCLSVAIFLERLTPYYYLSPTLKAHYQEIVKDTKTEAVLDIPFIESSASTYNLLPFYYEKKSIFGYFHAFEDTPKTRAFMEQNNEITRFRCDSTNSGFTHDLSLSQHNIFNNQMLARLKLNNIDTIVIHKGFFDGETCYETRLISMLLLNDLTEEEAKLTKDDYFLAKNFIDNLSSNRKFSKNKLKRIYDDEDVIVYVIK